MIASTMDPEWQLVVVAVSLVTSYAIVFVAGFSRQDRRHSQQGIFQRPGAETIVTYLAALVVAALLLWVFQRGVHPPADLLSRVIVLGFPAAIGGAVNITSRLEELTKAFGVQLVRSEEHTSELQSLMRLSYAVFCLT